MFKTQGFVLGTVKYGDNNLIVKIFTRQFGLKSFMVRGAYSRKNKKAALLHPCALLEIDMADRQAKSLQTAKHLQRAYNFVDLHGNVVKSAQAMFICELLQKTIPEDYENELLFDFLFQSMQVLDLEDEVANFHLWFMISLSRYYGFCPEIPEEEALWQFNLQQASFTLMPPVDQPFLNEDLAGLFLQFLGTNFDKSKSIKLNQKQRNGLLDGLLLFFQLHVDGFGKLNSHEILRAVFA